MVVREYCFSIFRWRVSREAKNEKVKMCDTQKKSHTHSSTQIQNSTRKEMYIRAFCVLLQCIKCDIGYFLFWWQVILEADRDTDGLITSWWWSVTGMIAVWSLLVCFLSFYSIAIFLIHFLSVSFLCILLSTLSVALSLGAWTGKTDEEYFHSYLM